MSSDEFERITDIAVELNNLPLFFDDASGISFNQLASRAKQLKSRRGLDLIVIDNVQILQRTTDSSGNSKGRKTFRVSAALKDLAKELSVSIIALSRLPGSRTVRDDRPQLSDLDRSLEQDADAVILIHRDDHYISAQRPNEENRVEFAEWLNKMDAAWGKAEAIIVKNRRGPTGMVPLQFDAPITLFSEVAAILGGAALSERLT